jgi:hypothetical protein
MASNSKIPSRAMEKRILKSGTVTQDDINEYMAQVGPETLKNMGINEGNIEEYIKNIVELGRKQKKKLPKKTKIESSDSLVVANQKDELAKVNLEEQNRSSPEPSSGTGNSGQGFRSFGSKLLSAGVFSFNKMFPALGTLMAALDKKIMKRDDDLKTVNASNQENARQVSRASVFLGKVAEAQLRTNELLEKIIQASSSPPVSAPTPAPGSGQGPNVEIDLDRRRSSVPQTGQTRAAASTPTTRSVPRGALVAGGLLVAGGAAAVGAGVVASRQGAGGQLATQLRPEAGTFRMTSTEHGMLNATYARTAEGRHTIDDREVDAETYGRFRQLSEPRLYDNDPRYLRYLEEARSRDELAPEMVAKDRVKDEDTGELIALLQRVRTQGSAQPTGQRQPAGSTGAVAPNAAAAAAGSVAERQQQQTSAGELGSRILHLKAKDIIFKADNYEFDQPPAGFSVPAPASGGSVSSGGSAVVSSSSSTTTTPGQSSGIQSVVQKITQEFPNINVTSVLRAGSGTSQHASGNAADLSLRGLSQDQRASLLQNIVSGKYGNIGGLGTYNATGDLLHVDTRTGPKMAWGPNRSRTSINETPQWFQSAVTPWMGGSGGTATASQEQEPRPGGEQMATPAATSPSSGAQIAQASVQSEVATMQAQQVTSPTNESPEQPAGPTGSMEQTATFIDPNEPGPVEPADAAQRYAKLFNMAA